METLSDKLKSLGVKLGTAVPKPQVSTNKIDIESIIEGENRHNHLGDYFLASWDYLPGTQIGEINLSPSVDSSMIVEWGKSKDLTEVDFSHFYFLDTETSSLGGGTGTFAFMVGLCYIDQQGTHVRQFFMRDPSEEPAMLAGLLEVLENARALVTYNGKAFDLPLLRNRYILNRIPMPFYDLPNIDLLPLARRIWKNRLANRGLKDLETEILGVRREEIEVPGWLIPELYFEYLRTKNATPLGGVFYHNRMDVVSLLALYEHFSYLFSNPVVASECEGLDIVAVAQLYDDLGYQEKALDFYRAGIETGLPTEFVAKTLLRWAGAQFATDRTAEGLINLQRAASEFYDINACIVLAKYYEHKTREYQEALQWTETAITYMDKVSNLEIGSLLDELMRRRSRLKKKLGFEE